LFFTLSSTKSSLDVSVFVSSERDEVLAAGAVQDAVVELSTGLLTEDDTEIDADPASLCGDNKGVDEA